jgi:hypothetical protein
MFLGVTPPKPGRQREKNLLVSPFCGWGDDYTLSLLGIKILQISLYFKGLPIELSCHQARQKGRAVPRLLPTLFSAQI